MLRCGIAHLGDVMGKIDLVVKSNKLTEASYRLDLIEQRIILSAIVEAREHQKGLGDDFITLDAKRFQTTFGMADANVYKQLKEAMETLFSRYVIIRDIHPESGHERVTKARWISSASYIDGSGTIQIRFAPEMVPFITRLEGAFTQYRLEKIGNMSSAHAVRLYELLIQYLALGEREVEIAWLKQSLELGNDYPRIDNFKRRVVDVAVQQINEHSDIHVNYVQRKTGRAVTHLIFTIKNAESTPTKAKKKKKHVVDRAHVEQHARPGESYDMAYQRLLEIAKNNLQR